MVSSHYGKHRYEDLLGNVTGWHHYAIVWSVDGLNIPQNSLEHRLEASNRASSSQQLPKAAVFIDGRCVMSTISESWDGANLSQTSSTLFFPNREDEMPWYGRIQNLGLRKD